MPAKYGYFDNPTNSMGIVSKKTKVVANEVDNDILMDKKIIEELLNEER